MSLTNIQIGGWNVLGGAPASLSKFAGMWTNQCWFVDGDSGGDGNAGNSPDNPFKTLTKAIAVAGVNDTIFIKPMVTATNWDTLYGATAPTSTYLENVSLTTSTKNGLSIIGTGNGFGPGGKGVQMSGVSAIVSPTIDVKASLVNIENINFGFMAAQITTASPVIRIYNVTASGGYAYGVTIANCGFEYNLNPEGCIRVDNAPGCAILGNSFRNVEVPLYGASLDHAIDVLYFIGNRVTASVLTLISADVVLGTANNVMILNNHFAHGIPGHVGGYGKYIYCAGVVTGSVQGNHFSVTGTAMATNNTLSTLTFGGNFGMAGPYIT